MYVDLSGAVGKTETRETSILTGDELNDLEKCTWLARTDTNAIAIKILTGAATLLTTSAYDIHYIEYT